MKGDNTSQLGPWNRYQEPHQDAQQQGRLTLSITPAVMNVAKGGNFLPRVSLRQPPLVKQSQSRTKLSLKMRPIQMQIQQQLSKTRQVLAYEPYKSRTLSFEPPVISLHNKQHPRLARFTPKPLSQQPLGTQTPRVCHITLLPAEQQPGVMAECCSTIESSRNGLREREFSRKRSLKELIRTLKGERADSARYSEMGHERNENSFVNMSLQASPRYIPYFEARKSHYSLRKK